MKTKTTPFTLTLDADQCHWLLEILAGFVEGHINTDDTDPTPPPAHVQWAQAVAERLHVVVLADDRAHPDGPVGVAERELWRRGPSLCEAHDYDGLRAAVGAVATASLSQTDAPQLEAEVAILEAEIVLHRAPAFGFLRRPDPDALRHRVIRRALTAARDELAAAASVRRARDDRDDRDE